MKSNHGNTNPLDALSDPDNEEAALHEFDFLTADSANTGRKLRKDFLLI
jgi:hypothetical protein